MSNVKTDRQETLAQKKSLEGDCPSCGKSSIVRDYHQNITICENCGRVLREDIKDMGPEWRAYNQNEKNERSRGGPPVSETIHDKGLSTQIDWKDRDSRGNSLSPGQKAKIRRMRRWHKSTKLSNQKDRNLSTAFSEIDRISSQLGLPRKVRNIAARVYREAVDRDLIRGHSIEGISTATLYLACRKAQIPRTLEEIAEVSYVNKNELGKNYRYITRKLDIYIPPVNPVNYVARFGSELDLSGETRTKAIELIKKAEEKKITLGKGPAGTAAGAIYLASKIAGENRTQKEVAEVANVTAVTLRNRYRELMEELDIDNP